VRAICCARRGDPSRSSNASSPTPATRGQGWLTSSPGPARGWALQIVKRSDAHRFVILPKRWIVERTFAWISRNRRLARDFERYARTVAAFFRLAMIPIMLRRLTRINHSP
jgi:transposase